MGAFCNTYSRLLTYLPRLVMKGGIGPTTLTAVLCTSQLLLNSDPLHNNPVARKTAPSPFSITVQRCHVYVHVKTVELTRGLQCELFLLSNFREEELSKWRNL